MCVVMYMIKLPSFPRYFKVVLRLLYTFNFTDYTRHPLARATRDGRAPRHNYHNTHKASLPRYARTQSFSRLLSSKESLVCRGRPSFNQRTTQLSGSDHTGLVVHHCILQQPLSKSTTTLSPGGRGGATAWSALGWYRPSRVLVKVSPGTLAAEP